MMQQVLTRGDEFIATADVQAVCMDPAGRAKRPPKWMAEAWAPYIDAGA
jgi:acyl-CoA thioester hydrolase